ncbi:MAG: radical SAM protein [Pseudomonadota bacterium]
MALGLKSDYLYPDNLRLTRQYNLFKNILFQKRGRLISYPRRYSIEPTTVCNLRCPCCIHSRYDESIHLKREVMTYDAFEIIFEKIKRYALLVEFYNFGEPFLNKDTPAMVSTATRAGIRSRISSNMSAKMSDSYIRQIVESGLYRLTCSIDGATQEVYEKYRAGGNLATVLDNADRVIFYKKKLRKKYPLVVYRMLVFEWNQSSVDDARRLARDHGFNKFYADAGSFDVEGKRVIWDMQTKRWKEKGPKFCAGIPEKAPIPCEWLFNGMIINANGNVMPCCFSSLKKGEHLSLLHNSLEDIWNSPLYINTRLYTLGLSTDRSTVFPLCRNCRLL